MNVFVYTDNGFPAEIRDRILGRLREKHPAARVQRLDAGKADRILVLGAEPDFVRFFRKTGTPTVIYRPDGTFDTYDEALFLAKLRTELDAVEVADYAGRRHGGRTGFDEHRNTSRVFGVPAGSADAAVEASRAWQKTLTPAVSDTDNGEQLEIGGAA